MCRSGAVRTPAFSSIFHPRETHEQRRRRRGNTKPEMLQSPSAPLQGARNGQAIFSSPGARGARRQSTGETHLGCVGLCFSFAFSSPSQRLLRCLGSVPPGLGWERRVGSRAVLPEAGEGSAAAPHRAGSVCTRSVGFLLTRGTAGISAACDNRLRLPSGDGISGGSGGARLP